jgi:signal transduction histidine kinase
MGDRTGTPPGAVIGQGLNPSREWPPPLDEPREIGEQLDGSRPGSGRGWPPPLDEDEEDRGVLGAGRPGSGSFGRIPLTGAIVFVSLLLALALSAAAVYQVFQEYRLLGPWLNRPEPVPPSEIQDLQWDIGTRIIIRSTALIVLLLCTTATLWLQQRQLAVRRALHQVTLLARDILVSMDQGVITTDPDMAITSINSAAMQILAVGPECAGEPLERIGAGAAALVALAGLVGERRAPVWDQDFTLGRGGRTRRIRADAHVLKDRKGRELGCVMLLRDVSDRVLMEERVRRMERFLSLGTLASGLHHEIKNPLTALSIHVQLLEKRLRDPASRKPLEELIGVVKSEVLRLNGVLESFRDFASLQRLTLQPADVEVLLGDVARLIGPQAAQQRVEVVVQHHESGLPHVRLDVEKIKQAVLNLVINAIEAMPEGGSLVLATSARDGELLVEVSDTGPGIPPEIQPSLFKPYFSTKAQGTGMGLALTEKLVGQHGGRIEFRTGSRGTTFTIAIPMEPVARGKDPA